MVFELLYLGVLLLRVAAWFVRVLVLLHVALVVVALPAGLLVRAGVIRDVDAFAVVICAWAGLLLCAWCAAAAARTRAPATRSQSRANAARGSRRAPVRVLRA